MRNVTLKSLFKIAQIKFFVICMHGIWEKLWKFDIFVTQVTISREAERNTFLKEGRLNGLHGVVGDEIPPAGGGH